MERRVLEQNTKALKARIEGMEGISTPFLLFVNFPLISSLTGVKGKEYFSDAKTMMDAQVDAFRMLGTDGPLSPDTGTVAEASALGGRVIFDSKGIPSIQADAEKELEDYEGISVADPYTDGWMARCLTYLDYFVTHKPEDMRVAGSNAMAPATTCAALRGIEDFCVDLLEEPEAALKLLETAAQSLIAYFQAQKKILGDAFERILMSDDIASFLSLPQFERFVAPGYKKIYGAFPGIERWLHNDGNAVHIASVVARTGIDLWHIGRIVDMGVMFEKTEGKVALCGNLSPTEDLLNGTREEVYARARKEIEAYASTGKHILSTGGFLSYGTRVENIQALMQAALDMS